MNKINELPVYEWGKHPKTLKYRTTLYKEGLRMTEGPVAITRTKSGAEYLLYDSSKTEPITPENIRPEERKAFNAGLKKREKFKKALYPGLEKRSLSKKDKELLSKSIDFEVITALNLPMYTESELPSFLYPPVNLLNAGFKPNGGPAGVLTCNDGSMHYVYYGVKGGAIKNLKIADLKAHPDKYVILDTETTGFNEDDEVIQLTCVDLGGNVLYDSYFNPVKKSHWAAVKKHKLSNDFLATQPLWKDEWEKINTTLKGKIILAHNASFDRRLIQQTCQRYGVEFHYISEYQCTMSFLKLKTGQSSLEKILKTLGYDFNEESLHNARMDCFMLLKVLMPKQEVFAVQTKAKSMFERVCRYKKEQKGDPKALEAGWNWIHTTFKISNKYRDFKILDMTACQLIIKDLEVITHKLNLVNFN